MPVLCSNSLDSVQDVQRATTEMGVPGLCISDTGEQGEWRGSQGGQKAGVGGGDIRDTVGCEHRTRHDP